MEAPVTSVHCQDQHLRLLSGPNLGMLADRPASRLVWPNQTHPSHPFAHETYVRVRHGRLPKTLSAPLHRFTACTTRMETRD